LRVATRSFKRFPATRIGFAHSKTSRATKSPSMLRLTLDPDRRI
jgi:hypothetical protein